MIFEKPEKDLKELKNQLERFEQDVYKEKLKKKMNEDRGKYEENEENSQRNPNDFVGKFKGIIGKLEEKLSRMSAELKLNESFR